MDTNRVVASISGLSDVIAFHRDEPFQSLRLTCDELQDVLILARYAQQQIAEV